MKKDINIEEILAQFLQKERDMDAGLWSSDPQDYLLFLSEIDDPQDFSAYWICERHTGWILQWENEQDQERAVRSLLDNQVPIVRELP